MSFIYYGRLVDVHTDVVKKYQTVNTNGNTPVIQNIEVDSANNLVYRLTGDGITPGTFAVLDYTRSMCGFYDAGQKKCFLIGGIQNIIADAQTMTSLLAKNITQEGTGKTLNYKVSDAYPISDKSILPAQLRDACSYLPVYWLESTATQSKEKRGCFWICTLYSDGSYICIEYC